MAVTKRDDTETNRDASVTPCHAASRPVTPSVPNRAEPAMGKYPQTPLLGAGFASIRAGGD